MAENLSHYFLTYAEKNLVKANEHLGRSRQWPGGGVDPEATDQEITNHAAIVELTEAIENLMNWAVELDIRLESAGVVQLERQAP